MKLLGCGVAFVCILGAQTVVINGPGGGGVDLSGVPDKAVLTNDGGTVSGNGTLRNYPDGIPDPDTTPAVAVHGTPDGTDYGYAVFEVLGTGSVSAIAGSAAAATLPSPTATVTSNSTLDSTNYNSITVPTVSDVNVFCVIVRVSGPQSPQKIRTLACNGSTWNDQALGSADGFLVPTTNTTTGISLPSGFVSTGQSLAVSTFASSGVITPDAGGNRIGFFYQIAKEGTWVMYDGSTALQDMWFAGWATTLTSVDDTNTPYQITVHDGTIKCDATAGNVAVTLPDPSTDPEFVNNDNENLGLGTFARYYVVHKVDSSANTCTVTASAGTTIDGAGTYVLTQPHESVTVYWDGASWPTSNRLAFSKLLGPMIGTPHTPASSSEPCTPGQFSDDDTYHYVCTAPNTWKRVALSSF